MNKEEYYDITYNLERYHEIFSTLWKITQPRFTNKIQTAAVKFEPGGGCIDFEINPDFWDSLDDYNKEFTICHEMCHIILQHGLRSSPYRDMFKPQTVNIALDLAVNHLLTTSFGFSKFYIQDWENYVWADTVFKNLDLEPNKAFEYYISKIEKDGGNLNQEVNIIDHSYLDAFNAQANNTIQSAANTLSGMNDTKKEKSQKDQMQQEISNSEKNNIEGMGKGESGFFSIFIGQDLSYRKTHKWESVLNKYVLKAEKDREFSQWVRLNRRLSFIKNKLFLPSDAEIIDRDYYRYNVWLFLDYSGSCEHLQDIFFKASNTFDPRKFKIRKFAHTTEVGEFNQGKVKVWGGGTDFQCIENYIQQEIKDDEIKNYPDAIFHFTDGAGHHFTPQYPDRWYVFLTERYSTKQFYPQGVNFFKLGDYVENYVEY